MKNFVSACIFLSLCMMPGCGGNSSNSGNSGNSAAPPALKSIQVSPSAPSVAAGLTQQMTATAKYSDGSTQDVTSSATWSSSNNGVATVSNTGVATAKAVGSATIKAELSGVNGTVSLTVTAATLTAISVSPSAASIAAHTTQQFKATGTFTDGSTQNVTGQVQWTSSNTSVAGTNVNGASGLTVGLAAGNSTITAVSGNISSTATLTVTSATLTSLEVTAASASIPLATVVQFTATGTFSDNTTQDISDVATWVSSNTNILSLTVSGLATGKNLGTATVTASFESVVSPGFTATVNASDLVSLTIQPANPTIAATTSVGLSAIGTLTNGGTRDFSSEVTWASNNTAVATVGSDRAKGVSPGTADISATLGTVTGSTVLTVTDATLTLISLVPANSTIAQETQVVFVATGTFSDGSTQVINYDVTWASSNTSVATIGVTGTVVSVASGTTTISATLDSVKGSTGLNVSSATLESIAVSPSTTVLAPTATLQYSAVGTFSDGSQQFVTETVVWSSSDSNVASISSFGLATGQSSGTASITATQGSILSPAAAVVVEATPLTAVSVTPATAKVAEQTGVQFQATGTFGDGSTEDLTTSVLWGSTPSSVATVGDSPPDRGFATGVAPGSATITALFAGESGSATLTVTNATLTSIAVTPSNPDVSADSSVQFAAVGTFSDGTTETLTTQVNWASSDASVATISLSGLARSAAAGTTTISASLNGVSGKTTLTVQ